MEPRETNLEIFPISESKRRFSSSYELNPPTKKISIYVGTACLEIAKPWHNTDE